MIEDNTSAAVQIDVLIDGEVWSEVKTFENCAPDDHKYMVDPQTGKVLFGDGKHGLRPPAGSRVTENYQTGGGSVGNILCFSWTVSDSNIHSALLATITVLPDSFRLSMFQGDVQSWRWKLVAWLCEVLKARLLGSLLSKQ
jgi:hypothetical protein